MVKPILDINQLINTEMELTERVNRAVAIHISPKYIRNQWGGRETTRMNQYTPVFVELLKLLTHYSRHAPNVQLTAQQEARAHQSRFRNCMLMGIRGSISRYLQILH